MGDSGAWWQTAQRSVERVVAARRQEEGGDP
jgi:hypothetical protein